MQHERSTKYFIDTNIFLHVLFAQEKEEICGKLLEKINHGEIKGISSPYVLSEIVWKEKESRVPAEEIAKDISAILSIQNLSFIQASSDTILQSMVYMREYGLNHVDSVVVATVIKETLKFLVSYDTDFDKVSIVERVEPEELV
ncbi:MAG: type II toxin-antitoxin system VapC family toxin [Candidatus Hydrothermarchaeales archaeon]